MARARKEYRELIVSEAINYEEGQHQCCGYRDCGFRSWDLTSEIQFLVKCEDRKLIITPDTSKAELVEEEKAFMEQGTRKLHEKFLMRKKELHARFAAERQSNHSMVAEAGLEA